MRSMFALVTAALVFTCAASAAADPDKVGSLVLVNVKGGKKEVDAKVGDLIQFELSYAVVPDQLVSELKVETGKGLSKVGTFHVQKLSPEGRPLVGAMAIAVFVQADKAGDVTVKIVPKLSNGKDGDKAEFKVKVAKE